LVWLVGNADPAGQVSDADEAAGEEESQNGEDSDDGYVPTVGLGEGQADSGDLAADARAKEWAAGHGLRDGDDGAAV
jgi:hypothetical protein